MADKVAIYDFCQTIVDFETADAFVDYITSHERSTFAFFVEEIRYWFGKLKISWGITRLIQCFDRSYSLNKRIKLYELKGLSKDKITDYAKGYYRDMVKPHLIEPIIERMEKEKEEGYRIIIVSASYMPVIAEFSRDIGIIDDIITNELRYSKKNHFSGRISKEDCIGQNKVKKLLERFPEINQMSEIRSYGDSHSDIPILDIADRRFVVSHLKSKVWAKERGFEEIIW